MRAVGRVLVRSATFAGRARRPEFWWFFLFYLLAVVAAHVVDLTVGVAVQLVLALPMLAVSARRMHDVDRSAWSLLVCLVPLVGPLVFLMWASDDGQSAVEAS